MLLIVLALMLIVVTGISMSAAEHWRSIEESTLPRVDQLDYTKSAEIWIL